MEWIGDKDWSESIDDDDEEEDDDPSTTPYSYVPIDPCQSVIAALRFAMGEHLPLRFIDLEVSVFETDDCPAPDAFALREVSLETFAASLLPAIKRPRSDQLRRRLDFMASELREASRQFKHVVALCSIHHWPWLREAYLDASRERLEPEPIHEAESMSVDENTLIFLLSELPFVTGIYEESRRMLDVDLHAPAVDGIKRLLMAARTSYMADLGPRGRRITPLLLSQCLKYIRNLTLLDRRLTPDLYTLAVAAKQVLGDQYAIHLVEAARNYPFFEEASDAFVTLGVGKARLPEGESVSMVNRLAGSPCEWRSIELNRKPLRDDSRKWQMQWNPYRQCSWPPEDEVIESFRTRVIENARAALGADLARTEKFSTSLMDGLDIRETMRHWFDGDLYVKVQPPSIGHLDACVLLFEAHPDPRDYTWRTTWFAEHAEESTLAFCATDFRKEMLGPGIAVANYGAALFLYPPRSIPDIWHDPQLDFADTLEDRIIAAACLHAQSRHIALMSPMPPNAAWRSLAKRHGKKLVHVPMGKFNDAMLQQLRTVHVLNGQEVRSFAAHFIRKA
jgi:hypothetical protein